MKTPLGHNRHQLSLEGILDFSQPLTLAPHEIHNARTIFDRLIEHYHPEQTPQRVYKPVALVQTTFDHVSSKDAFLMLFFPFIMRKYARNLVILPILPFTSVTLTISSPGVRIN